MPPLDLRDVHRRIAEMARDLHNASGADGGAMLSRVTDFAVSALPGADYAGVTVLLDRRRIETPATTHHYPKLLGEIQNRRGEGPSLHAALGSQPVRADDLSCDIRWPAFCLDAIAHTPVRSVMALPLFAGRQSLGTLDIYADLPNAFDEAAEDIGVAFATHAALAWDSVRRKAQFRKALESRDIIGQAKGMIMERYRLDANTSFELLKKMSQDSNTPLAVIAQELVAMNQPKRRDKGS
jgi:GAF domain-containing protein